MYEESDALLLHHYSTGGLWYDGTANDRDTTDPTSKVHSVISTVGNFRWG